MTLKITGSAQIANKLKRKKIRCIFSYIAYVKRLYNLYIASKTISVVISKKIK